MALVTGKEGAMKIGLLAVLLTCALVSVAGAATVTMTPPDLQNKQAVKPSLQPQVRTEPRPQLAAPSPRVMETKPKASATPSPPAARPQAKIQTAAKTKLDCPCECPPDRAARRDVRHRHAGTYRYAAAVPWHGQWRRTPNDAFGPEPAAPSGDEGLRIEDRGWTGGVGYAPDGGGGGGFVDGYGQVHFANGAETGPTYNSYGQSFQFNPSQAGPFQPRLMGGLAPSSR